ncbi:MAG: hypothetical protein LBG27_00535 [Spirochaetaceae bacterium]|nr:hypothetical protein [Spirochaetaceae bacterium]
MITVGRPINGISINGCEWLLDDSKNLKVFTEKNIAIQFLKEHGVSDNEMADYIFNDDVGEDGI